MRRIEALQIDAGLLIYIVIILVAWALVNYTFLQRVENFVCISYDTLGYVRFRIFRPPGYGLFVNAVRAVLDDARWIIPIQLNAMLFSMALFGYAAGRLAKSRWFGLVLTIMMFATLPVLQYSYHLISESIFIAFLLLHFAFVALFIDSRSWTFAILSGFMLFCLIAVRPAGYSVAVTIPLLLWFMRRDWPRILGGVMGSFLGGLIFMGTANFIHHGIWSGQSLAGLSLLGHVAFLIDERDAKGEHRDLIATIAANNENISRPLRETAFPHEHWKRTSEAYNQLLWRGAFPVISDHVREGETDIKYDAGDQTSEISTLNELSDGIWRQTSGISMDIATQVISEKPLSYVRHVLANFYGMWHVLLYGTSSISENLLQCIKASQDIVTQHGYLRENLSEYLSIDHLRDENIIKTLELRSDTQTGFQHFWLLVSRNQNIVLAIGIPISLLFLLIGVLSPKEPLTIFVSFCAVQIFAYFIFISAVQAALVRYSVPFIPIFYVILFGGGLICSRMILKRLTS